MKTNLKRTLCLLLIAVMLLTAAGCSAATPQATAQPTQAPAPETAAPAAETPAPAAEPEAPAKPEPEKNGDIVIR